MDAQHVLLRQVWFALTLPYIAKLILIIATAYRVRKQPTKYGFGELNDAAELDALLTSICTG